MARDRLGNEINLGDLLLVPLTKPEVMARVTDISEGGVSMVGGRRDNSKNAEQVTPGRIVCTLITQTFFDPTRGMELKDGRVIRGICVDVTRVMDPDPDEAKRVMEMAKEHQKRGKSGLLLLQ